MFAGNFAPAGWMFCEGQLLPISENDILFNLIGTTYGGDGQETFALPDLRGRIPIHMGTGPSGTNHQLAETGGAEEITLTVQQIPVHSHPVVASEAPGLAASPSGHVLAASGSVGVYLEDAPSTNAHVSSIAGAGGSQPHTNFQPYLCVSFIISLFGIYPSPT